MLHNGHSYKFLVFGVGILLSLELSDASAVYAQGQSQPKARPEQNTPSLAPKDQSAAKKWTDDDLASVRKPWDLYQDEKATALKQAAEAATKFAAVAAEARAAAVCDSAAKLSNNSVLPKTAEKTDAKIQQTQDDIQQKKSSVEKATQDYQNATTDVERSELKTKLDGAKDNLQSSQDDLKLLQFHLDLLKAGAAPTAVPTQ